MSFKAKRFLDQNLCGILDLKANEDKVASTKKSSNA
jgi:hypothetical protein